MWISWVPCHIHWHDTQSACFSSSSASVSSKRSSEMQTMYLYWKTMLKTTETMMMNAVAEVWMTATLSLCVSIGCQVISSDPHAKLVTQNCCDLLRRSVVLSLSYFGSKRLCLRNFDIIRHISVLIGITCFSEHISVNKRLWLMQVTSKKWMKKIGRNMVASRKHPRQTTEILWKHRIVCC